MSAAQKLDEKPVRNIAFPTLIETASEEGLESLDGFMDRLEEEATEYMREELGLEDFERPKQGLRLEDELPLVERSGMSDHLGVYRDRDDLAAIKLQPSFSKPFSTAVHEMVHADQYKRMLGLDLGEDTPQEVLAGRGLAEIMDMSEGEAGYEGLSYSPNPLVEDLLSETQLSYSEVAKAVYEDEKVASKLENLQSKYDEVGEDPHERFARNIELASEVSEGEEWSLEENEEAREVVEETYETVVSALDDTKGRGFYSPDMLAEMEGFAHYVSAMIENKRFDRKAEVVEENYNMEFEDGRTVGEVASERIDELGKIHGNLTEYGDMSDEEAANYMLTEVQPRKFEYAAD